MARVIAALQLIPTWWLQGQLPDYHEHKTLMARDSADLRSFGTAQAYESLESHRWTFPRQPMRIVVLRTSPTRWGEGRYASHFRGVNLAALVEFFELVFQALPRRCQRWASASGLSQRQCFAAIPTYAGGDNRWCGARIRAALSRFSMKALPSYSSTRRPAF